MDYRHPAARWTRLLSSDDSLWFQEDKGVGRAGPIAAQGRPEESVHGVQCWPRSFAFDHGKLLPKGEDFEGDVAATANEDPDGGQD